MDPYTHRLPDTRLMHRLIAQLRHGDKIGAFMAAGEALAIAILATRGGGELPLWVDPLADAMVGALLLVEDQTIDDADVGTRLKLSTAAIVLSTVRPRSSAGTDGAVSMWMNWGMGSPAGTEDPLHLLTWTLLRLFQDDHEGAAHTLHAAIDLDPFGPGMVLYDWVVSRVQKHGEAREAQCFDHFRTRLLASDSGHPSLLVLAAVVLNQCGPMCRGEVLAFLDDWVGANRLGEPRMAR